MFRAPIRSTNPVYCALALVGAAGCHDPEGSGGGRRDPGVGHPNPGAVYGPRETQETHDAVLIEGGVAVCADPGARDAARYDTEWLDVPRSGIVDIEGGGLVIADLDGDGWLDLVAAGAPPRLFRGVDGGRAFAEEPGALVGLDVDGMVGGSAADYDGDGDPDLFLTRWERPDVLLRNDGGAFTDVSAQAGVAGPSARSVTSAWDDVDGDGDLDLFVGRYGPVPDFYAVPLESGDPSSLFRNRGDGTFDDASDALPDEVQLAWVFQAGWYDLDVDGDRELLSVHDFGRTHHASRMLRNDGGALALDDTAGFHPAFDGMGMGVGDLNGDGLPDLLQTSNRDISLLTSLPSAVSATGVLFVESADAMGLVVLPGTGSPKGQDWGWGVELGDLDDDGDLDAVAAFGRWDTWFGNPVERDAVFEFDGAGFTEVAGLPEWSMDWEAATRGLALVDLDRDGWLDVVRNALDAPVRVDRARCGSASWLAVALHDGIGVNPDGIGARVELVAGGRTRTAWIDSGSSSLFTGGPPEAHFGLGSADLVDEICVAWPDGARDCFGALAARQRVEIAR